MNKGLLVLAASVVFLALSGRYGLSSSDAGIFRIDRLTGEVMRCGVEGDDYSKVVCKDWR